MSKVEMVDGARDYRLMTKQMVEAIISMKEYNRYSKGLFSFVGFNTKWIEYENIERVAGETKWSFWKLFKYAIEGITAFSTTPLIIAISNRTSILSSGIFTYYINYCKNLNIWRPNIRMAFNDMCDILCKWCSTIFTRNNWTIFI